MKKNKITSEQKSNNLNKSNTLIISILIVLICTAGASVCAYLFYTNINAALTRADAKLKGTVIWKNHSVQRRFSNRFVWGGISNGSPIYEGDLIRTDKSSDASILLDGGARLDMQENCLIEITTDKWGRVNLQFLGGDISVKTEESNIVIKQGKKQLEVKANTSVRAVAQTDSEDVSFTVEGGYATLQNGTVTQEIDGGTQLSVDSEGIIREEKKVTLQNVSGLIRQIQTSDPTIPVELEWKTNGGEMLLEVSSDNRFSNIVFSRIQNSTNAQISLPPGLWWWRVTPISENETGRADGKVIITRVEQPEKIVEPVTSPVVLSFLSEEKPVSTIREVNLTTAVTDPSKEPNSLKEPEQALKVPVQATPATPKPLPAPRLLSPDTPLNAAAFRGNKNVIFSWSSVPGARAYIWNLQSGDIQTSIIVRETSFVYDASRITNGVYTWSVAALRTVPASNNVNTINDRGIAAEKRWQVDIPMPKKPVLLAPIQDDGE
ncbi:hypothetical protein FACS1894102_5170 [Spirochaetia bacterium]|nr:hypothetical protein FACS1894102_5170 [Spirochaetia bacterium]